MRNQLLFSIMAAVFITVAVFLGLVGFYSWGQQDGTSVVRPQSQSPSSSSISPPVAPVVVARRHRSTPAPVVVCCPQQAVVSTAQPEPPISTSPTPRAQRRPVGLPPTGDVAQGEPTENETQDWGQEEPQPPPRPGRGSKIKRAAGYGLAGAGIGSGIGAAIGGSKGAKIGALAGGGGGLLWGILNK